MEPNEFPARLERMRMHRGWTLRELAAQIQATGGGVMSYSYLSALEKGKSSPSLQTLSRIAGAYGVSVSELLRKEGDDAQSV
jgi:transcriptional regulator with XRE-family HTH domain